MQSKQARTTRKKGSPSSKRLTNKKQGNGLYINKSLDQINSSTNLNSNNEESKTRGKKKCRPRPSSLVVENKRSKAESEPFVEEISYNFEELKSSLIEKMKGNSFTYAVRNGINLIVNELFMGENIYAQKPDIENLSQKKKRVRKQIKKKSCPIIQEKQINKFVKSITSQLMKEIKKCSTMVKEATDESVKAIINSKTGMNNNSSNLNCTNQIPNSERDKIQGISLIDQRLGDVEKMCDFTESIKAKNIFSPLKEPNISNISSTSKNRSSNKDFYRINSKFPPNIGLFNSNNSSIKKNIEEINNIQDKNQHSIQENNLVSLETEECSIPLVVTRKAYIEKNVSILKENQLKDTDLNDLKYPNKLDKNSELLFSENEKSKFHSAKHKINTSIHKNQSAKKKRNVHYVKSFFGEKKEFSESDKEFAKKIKAIFNLRYKKKEEKINELNSLIQNIKYIYNLKLEYEGFPTQIDEQMELSLEIFDGILRIPKLTLVGIAKASLGRHKELLSKMSKIKMTKLKFVRCNFDSCADFNQLNNMGELKNLSFVECKKIGNNENYFSIFCKSIFNLKLQKLKIIGSELNDKIISIMLLNFNINNGFLKYLDLSNNEISNDGLYLILDRINGKGILSHLIVLRNDYCIDLAKVVNRFSKQKKEIVGSISIITNQEGLQLIKQKKKSNI